MINVWNSFHRVSLYFARLYFYKDSQGESQSKETPLVPLTTTSFCSRHSYLRCVRHVVLVTALPLLLRQGWWNSLTTSTPITTTRPSILAITSMNLPVGMVCDEKNSTQFASKSSPRPEHIRTPNVGYWARYKLLMRRRETMSSFWRRQDKLPSSAAVFCSRVAIKVALMYQMCHDAAWQG